MFEDPKDPNRKTYLVLHDACASLGPIKAAKPIDSELRIYPGGDPIDNMVLHVQGRFCVVSPTGETPFLLAEIHRFDIMHIADPSAETTPDTVRTSVTTCGRAIPSDVVTDTRDRYFGLEMKEYIRDISHEFNITYRTSDFSLTHLLMIRTGAASTELLADVGKGPMCLFRALW